ncbi:Ycf66 family protein [bacterium]|nr:Ycf66 family protein [bacterium]
MVNASLNWASIVGIVLAVGGALLYFMRTFKPALARDYDVFFAAIGLLCGGILFFQGWRLDPILQFGQFLLAGTTVFFAYESVRLRGISAEQARRSAYFDDEPEAASPAGGGGLRGGYDDPYERFDEPQPIRRRFGGQGSDEDERPEQDFYRPRRTSRAAIPEQAASRSRQRPDPSSDWSESSERDRRMARFGRSEDSAPSGPSFGERRSQRQDQRRGSRPTPVASSRPEPSSRASAGSAGINQRGAATARSSSRGLEGPPGIPQGSPLRREPEDAAYSPSTRQPSSSSPFISGNQGSEKGPTTTRESNRTPPRSSRPRDNSSRFDD